MLSLASAVSPVDGVLYLHGFNSGSESPKARLMRAACARIDHRGRPLACLTPQLPHHPQAAYETAEKVLRSLGDNTLLVGSSMGGFLATCLAERFALPAVVINPAVEPARLVSEWRGMAFVNDYTGERFVIEASHRDELQALTPASLTPQRYLLLLGTADETLDCREAFQAYAGCRTLLLPGGDHGFSRLREFLPAVLAHGGHRLDDVPSAVDEVSGTAP
ncbi:alpha/beta fold hydrolase [Halomonas sp. McH1-25]|uniref:YqiA/YcfP family alpha/beta fold hydrolase n=1 Tax=unclassified Halomonas TaxID=2609666 RepID=UPI001EF4354F|nr:MULTISPECIES: YqiA/YcfP family alpha/beta fold hydrolase [unclassified Halomonas]MCG7600361.1 alpha/beta fold hydrolase [Halomonas sp. McH1-25]MCP1361487.1 alpha/beta fold hydrolase [Halomonas sp. BBD45]